MIEYCERTGRKLINFHNVTLTVYRRKTMDGQNIYCKYPYKTLWYDRINLRMFYIKEILTDRKMNYLYENYRRK